RKGVQDHDLRRGDQGCDECQRLKRTAKTAGIAGATGLRTAFANPHVQADRRRRASVLQHPWTMDSTTWFVADSSDASATGRVPDRGEADALDPYSRAVIDVVSRVGPATVSLSKSNDWSLRDEQQTAGSGSGVIISADGHALTNSHVVHGRKRLSARTAEGDTLDAQVVGDDP